jgi:alpha-ribazole phosphatase
MEIYLIRHTKPLIEKAICYGQTNVEIDDVSYEVSIKSILSELPESIDAIYTSPLKRCSILAKYLNEHIYTHLILEYSDLLKEIDFGNWENNKWDDIDQVDLQIWMDDFVNQKPHGGENFMELHQRVKTFLDILTNQCFVSVVIVTHAGVIRSILSHVNQTLLKDAFSIKCEYGSVIKLKLSGS